MLQHRLNSPEAVMLKYINLFNSSKMSSFNLQPKNTREWKTRGKEY